jgi:hypothetical protein
MKFNKNELVCPVFYNLIYNILHLSETNCNRELASFFSRTFEFFITLL